MIHAPVRLPMLALAAFAFFICGDAEGAANCDRACLLGNARLFNAYMLAHTPERLPLATGVRIRENARAIQLSASKWTGVARILSAGVFADAVTGNVIEHVAAQTRSGNTVYIGSRLKLVNRQIAEVEINFDDRPEVEAENLVPYDPIFDTLADQQQRSPRAELARIITAYFQGLSDHRPIKADYDARCDRYHSGKRITHNARNGIEDSGDVGCYESNLGARPWGPAVEVRIEVIDPERGIVVAYAVLRFGDSKAMQINEVFKILGGRIRLIDNIGLMADGLTTSGFRN